VSRAERRLYAAGVALVALAACGRVLAESRAELVEGRAALAAGQPDVGIRHLRRAAHLYLPGSPFVREAYASLESAARNAEVRGQPDQALAAWRAIRASSLATRWLLVPYADGLERANRRIARLVALQPPATVDRDLPLAQREERHLALLQQDDAPSPAWVVVMGLGFGAWVSAVAWAVARGWDDEDVPQWRVLRVAGAVTAAGMALFFLALARA
jgi:hypothetical protein